MINPTTAANINKTNPIPAAETNSPKTIGHKKKAADAAINAGIQPNTTPIKKPYAAMQYNQEIKNTTTAMIKQMSLILFSSFIANPFNELPFQQIP